MTEHPLFIEEAPPRAAGIGRAGWAWVTFQGFRDPYIILITIYIFAPYFVTSVVGDAVQGQAMVAEGAKYAGWAVMLTVPLLGAVVDRMGPRKPWLVAAVGLMLPLIVMLWWAKPAGAGLSPPTIVAILAAVSVLFAYSEALHNSLLLPAVGMEQAGAASGLGFGFASFVSFIMLAGVLWAFVLPGSVTWSFVPEAPLFGLDVAAHQPDRIVPVIVAVVMALGTGLLMRFVPDVASSGVRLGEALRLGFSDLKALIVQARGYRDAIVFLGARMLFVDGLTAILVFTGVYAAGAMGWQTMELLAYGMILCVFSSIGGFTAGWLDGRLGPKLALKLEICGVVLSQVLALGNTRTLFFYQPYDASSHQPLWNGPMFQTAPEIGLVLSGCLMAVTVVATYSSSRTLLTRIVPGEKVAVFFGLFVISGSATMWLGPLLVQAATEFSGSQRIGLLPISGLLLAGLLTLQWVRGADKPL